MKRIINFFVVALIATCTLTSATVLINKDNNSLSKKKSSNAMRRYAILSSSDEGIKFITISTTNKIYSAGGTPLLINGPYKLDFQGDYNLVLYNGTTPIWASGIGTGGNRLEFWTGGQIYRFAGTYLTWNSGSATLGNPFIWVLQDDGNFVGYDGYTVEPGPLLNPDIYVTGQPFAATGTAGGKKSKHSGTLN